MTHLVLILVLAAAVRSGACPNMCTCTRRSRDHQAPEIYYHSVMCYNYSENITSQLDETTHDLTFSEFSAGQLEMVIGNLSDEEISLPYLDQLTITQSVVPDLINLTFPTLRSINLSANKIGDLSDKVLDVAKLQTLDLSNNTIVTLKNETFRTLRKLENLNLSANFLTVVESASFCGLVSLKCLDLSHNNLSSLDDRLFTSLLSLQYLNLSNNQLESLNEKCFISLLKLQQLDLSWNRLIRVELDSLQLPSLARLLLAGNPKLGLSVLLVGTGQRLQTVDASRIGLKQVPAALTHSIRTLRLAENSISTVRCGDLDSYPLLQLLDFTSNGLDLIEDDALGRLDSLSILYLTNNTMNSIPKSLSEKLKVLHLERNKILKIGSKDLQGLTSLEVLLLNDNKISVIEEEAFNQLTSLVTLDISRNPIKILGCLSGSLTLQVLRLSNIGVISPPKEVSFPLSSPEHLITLDLSGSPGLARQLLVDTAALAASRELQELDLSNTDLDYIRSDLLHFLPQLRIFRIQGNRINCTQLEWLAAWMRRQDEDEYKTVACASPPELWGTLLIELQESEISQNFLQTTTQHNVLRQFVAEDEVYEEERAESMFPNGTASEELGFFKTSHLESSQLTNANEPQESPRNKLDRESDKTEISHNLFIASKGKTFNGPEQHNNNWNESFPEDLVDDNSNSSRTSMFREDQGERDTLDVLLLVVVLTGTAALLAMLAARFAKRKKAARRLRMEEEVEVGSLPGVTELW